MGRKKSVIQVTLTLERNGALDETKARAVAKQLFVLPFQGKATLKDVQVLGTVELPTQVYAKTRNRNVVKKVIRELLGKNVKLHAGTDENTCVLTLGSPRHDGSLKFYYRRHVYIRLDNDKLYVSKQSYFPSSDNDTIVLSDPDAGQKLTDVVDNACAEHGNDTRPLLQGENA